MEGAAMNDGKSIPKRFLGASGIEVSAIGLGCMSLSGVYGTSSDEDGIALIHQALDGGITLLDTSDMYGFGHNEELVGQAIEGRRGEVVLATKFGNLGGRGGKIAEGRPDYVISACEKSLKRLGVDVIDLYYQHRVDPTVPVEDTFGAMARLVAQGKVRALGISEARPETIRRAHAVHPIAAVQNEFSLLYRTEAEETLPTMRALNITFVAYSPLGHGLLTGAVAGQSDLAEADARRRHPRFAPENLGRNVALVQRIEEIAGEEMRARPVGAGLAVGAGQRHRADPRHEAAGAAEGKSRRARGDAERGGACTNLRCYSGWRRRGLALSGSADEKRLSVKGHRRAGRMIARGA
jgi:aryl-alcohol dehydrogenase-like predicted oxidoreductase